MNNYTNLALQRTAFMQNPPLCSAVVTYRTQGEDEVNTFKAIFFFNAARVESVAKKLCDDGTGLDGMHATLYWSSLRDESTKTPTEIPELLSNFDYVAEELIKLGHGQVKCVCCDKVYSVTELTCKLSGTGLYASGWISEEYTCNSGHVVFSMDVMHVMRKKVE